MHHNTTAGSREGRFQLTDGPIARLTSLHGRYLFYSQKKSLGDNGPTVKMWKLQTQHLRNED